MGEEQMVTCGGFVVLFWLFSFGWCWFCLFVLYFGVGCLFVFSFNNVGALNQPLEHEEKEGGWEGFEGRNLSVANILDWKTAQLPSLCGRAGWPSPLQGDAGESDPLSRAALGAGEVIQEARASSGFPETTTPGTSHELCGCSWRVFLHCESLVYHEHFLKTNVIKCSSFLDLEGPFFYNYRF